MPQIHIDLLYNQLHLIYYLNIILKPERKLEMEKEQFNQLTKLLEEIKKLLEQHDARLTNIEKALGDVKSQTKGKGVGKRFFDSMQV